MQPRERNQLRAPGEEGTTRQGPAVAAQCPQGCPTSAGGPAWPGEGPPTAQNPGAHQLSRNLGKLNHISRVPGREPKEREGWERVRLHLQQMLSGGGKYFYFPCGLPVDFVAAGTNGK